jgi:SAM-dependent methyltransferase
MDRPGRVVEALSRHLPPTGHLLDVGAGDGFISWRLSAPGRIVIPLEPDPGMLRRNRALKWVVGEAEALPFGSSSFDGVYSTWAYYFPSQHSIGTAVQEAERVLKPRGILAIVNNLGGDELSDLSRSDISEPAATFLDFGFSLEVVETWFEFDSLEQARDLLGFYFGSSGRSGAKIRLSFRVGLYWKRMAA